MATAYKSFSPVWDQCFCFDLLQWCDILGKPMLMDLHGYLEFLELEELIDSYPAPELSEDELEHMCASIMELIGAS